VRTTWQGLWNNAICMESILHYLGVFRMIDILPTATYQKQIRKLELCDITHRRNAGDKHHRVELRH